MLVRAAATLVLLVATPARADDEPADATTNRPRTQLWLGSYNTIRLSKKWYWEAQHHFRTSEYDGVPFVGRMGQIYNRHALTHRFSPSFFLTAGGVLRLNFASDPKDPELRAVAL